MARTVYEQTGWKRPYPETICQDLDAQLKITEYDYDMMNPEFVAYVKARIGYCLVVGDFLASDAKEDDDQWKKITRAKIQDCWELFNR